MVFVTLNSICACCGFLLAWSAGLCFRVILFVFVVSDFWGTVLFSRLFCCWL